VRRHSFSFGLDLVLPILFGVLFVLDINLMLAVTAVWVGILTLRSNARRDRKLSPLPLMGSLVSAVIFGSIVYAAASYEPTMTKLQLLSREISFPAKEIELAELAYLTSRANPDRQFTIRFSFPDADKQQVVHLPDQTVTLRQLLDAIERDTGMQASFSSCGNGYSILRGKDCCFGLHIQASYLGEEPFELYAYVDERFERLNR